MFDVGMNIFIWTGKLAKGVTRTKTRQELLNAKSILIKVINLDDAQYPRYTLNKVIINLYLLQFGH